MRIDANLLNHAPLQKRPSEANGAGASPSFTEVLRNSLEQVNQLQNEADQSAMALVVGKADNLHEVMIAGERAQLALQLTVAVRNKVVEAYQEISRMQV